MTLREFILRAGRGQHYRIYQPNRDCLIFESFRKVHSPYIFRDYSRRHKLFNYNKDYWDNNPFCDDVRHYKPLDTETKVLLKKFGNYKVFRIEASGFRPMNFNKDADGNLKITYIDEDPLRPGFEEKYIDCLDIFIIQENNYV